jgi:alpha-tubulin suppressor-like RCC1 family protein
MKLRLFLTLAPWCVIPACSGSTTPEQPTYLVEILPNTMSLILGGATATGTLNATVTRKLGANVLVDNTAPVTWTTSDVNVATVSGSGRTATVTGTGAGTATITATSNNGSGTATVSVTATTNTTFTRMIAGGSHTCGATAAGEVACWGSNSAGQLGDNSTTQRLTPRRAQTTLRFAALAAGANHTCALGEAGSASSCWGNGQFGQLGNGASSNSLTPVAISGGLTWTALTAGDSHTCGIASSGLAYCWGQGGSGQLGTGGVINVATPTAVQGNTRFTSIAAAGANTCAIAEAGETRCWGGRFGLTPVVISGGHLFTLVRLGGNHACGIVADGTAYCWGANQSGQLGTGGVAESPVPTAVQTSLRFTVIAPGENYTCGLVANGSAYCWGSNTDGQLGLGFVSPTQLTPVPVVGGFGFSGLRAGGRHTCGIALQTNAAICWGLNSSGQLGDGTTTTSSSPISVRGTQN